MITGHYNTIVSAYVTFYANGRRARTRAQEPKKACLVSIGCVASFINPSARVPASQLCTLYWQLCGLGVRFAAVLLKLHDYVHKDTFDTLNLGRNSLRIDTQTFTRRLSWRLCM
jgi:hypothetical protein